ncbi:hypothetical protein BpHYR1_026184 [Brachionus plicatilis]|uniref:RNA-directed DNA polymerase from mobile element jockey-like n=1 Tax=Brachionus plicatilis TaxID=10195 RepID=A0A3M7T968_BRAPC|nr:hypothetical protein BpHYR1_026184 [Brachionus plicatilis]
MQFNSDLIEFNSNSGSELFFLPKNIVTLIKERRRIRRLFEKSRFSPLKMAFNKLTSELRFTLKKFWNQNRLEFINKIGKNPLSNRVKKTYRTNTMEHNSDTDKGNIFGDFLATIFSPHFDFVESDYNCEDSEAIRDLLKNKEQNNLKEPITLLEITNTLKN